MNWACRRLQFNNTRTAKTASLKSRHFIAFAVAIFCFLSKHRIRRDVTVLPHARYLAFDVCNGFANQRIAIVTATLLAKRSGRILVIPSFLGAEGEQPHSLRQIRPTKDSSVAFSAVYDTAAFKAACFGHGVLAFDQADLLGIPAPIYVHPSKLAQSPSVFHHIQDVHVGCPVLTAPAQLFLKLEPVFWTLITTGLRPSDTIRDLVVKRQSMLGPHANFLHLRIEDDWVQFCKHWTQIADGVTRDNCLELDGKQIASRLATLGVSTRAPLYVASHWARVLPGMWNAIRADLKRSGHQVLTFKCELQREMCAAIDYYSALSVPQFVGNSVSTFSGLLIIERRHLGRHASYYNGGTLPLAQWLPFYKLAWIVISEPKNHQTVASWIDELKQSVESGVLVGNLQPFVLVSLGTDDAFECAREIKKLKTWLADRGARMIVTKKQATSWHALATLGYRQEWKDVMQHPFALVSTARIRFTARLDLYEFGSKMPVNVAAGACDDQGVECAVLANLAATRETSPLHHNCNKAGCSSWSSLLVDRFHVLPRTEHDISKFATF